MKPIEIIFSFRSLLWACLAWLTAMSMTSCLDDVTEKDDDLLGNFEAVWTAIDEHYCFFEEKNIDWNKVHAAFRPYAKDSIENQYQLLNLCDQMLDLLKDGHTNLYAPFNSARYWAWYEDYPANYDPNLVERYYLGTKYWIASGLLLTQFKEDSVAYIRYSSFASAVGETNLDYALAALRQARGLIIDIRDNGGGNLTNVPLIANRFATEKTLYGYIQHKTGPGHRDFSEPQPIYLEPEGSRFSWDASTQPVVVLANRSTFSAANNFVQAMKALDGTMTKDSTGVNHPKMIKIMGDKTGGGGGMPFETVIPNGWVLRFSACPITDRNKQQTEAGIDPDFHVELDSVMAYQEHKDAIIESARTYIINNTRMTYPEKESEKEEK